MKWIGQNIYDYISRFRSDVYLENISTGTIASGAHLGLDSNNKIVKAVDGGGDLTSIVAGTGLSGTSLAGPIPTLNVDAAQTGITSLGTLSSLAVTSASDLGSAAMTLTNADLDQIALDINASNTTANVIDINAVDASSGNVIFIDSADAVNEINIDKDYPRTVSHTGQVIKIASDKTATTGDSQTYSQTGLISSVSDGGRNHGNATSIVVNQDLTSNMGYADGTTTLYGIKNTLTGAADTAAGIYSNVGNDLGPDIYMVDSADTTNYCRIATTTNGALNITTHDQSGSDANVGFAVDGTFSVASTGIDIAADGTITNAAWQGTAINATYLDGQSGTNTGDETLASINALDITEVGTIDSGVWQGTAITSAYLDADTAHYSATKQFTHHVFKDDIDTTKHYIGLQEADAEGPSAPSKNLPFVAGVAGKLLKVFLRSTGDLSGKTLTWRLETVPTSSDTGSAPTIVGTQSGAGCTDQTMTIYDFSNVPSLDSGDNVIDTGDQVLLSIQSSASTTSVIYYVTCLWEWDLG